MTDGGGNQLSNVKVIDSLMGYGKTSWAIQYINDNVDENILYITPFLEEAERIKSNVRRDIRCPKNLGDGKLDNLCKLLENQDDIASTHALFMMLDDDCKEAIKQGQYTLFIDETLDAVAPFSLEHKDDIKFLENNGIIKIAANGVIEWANDCTLDTRFNQIRNLAKDHSLFFVNDKILMWQYPPEVFSLFNKVYVMTYLFDGSIMKAYFDLNKIAYDVRSICKRDDRYVLTEYFKPNLASVRDLINVYSGDDINDSFEQKNNALSVSWFRNPNNKQKVRILKNNIFNYFRHKVHGKQEVNMWTTFKESKSALKGKGYTKEFVACNCRATNDYCGKTKLTYAVNIYPHVGVAQYFLQHDIKLDADKYALSEMVQWIWRSAIRQGKPIWIYVPSRRMRQLLADWINS